LSGWNLIEGGKGELRDAGVVLLSSWQGGLRKKQGETKKRWGTEVGTGVFTWFEGVNSKNVRMYPTSLGKQSESTLGGTKDKTTCGSTYQFKKKKEDRTKGAAHKSRW